MIDSGSQPNIIKHSALRAGAEIDLERAPLLRGISGQDRRTLGLFNVRLYGKSTEFVVIADDFPTKTTVLLGAQFLRERDAVIDFESGKLAFDGRELKFRESVQSSVRESSGGSDDVRRERDGRGAHYRGVPGGGPRCGGEGAVIDKESDEFIVADLSQGAGASSFNRGSECEADPDRRGRTFGLSRRLRGSEECVDVSVKGENDPERVALPGPGASVWWCADSRTKGGGEMSDSEGSSVGGKHSLGSAGNEEPTENPVEVAEGACRAVTDEWKTCELSHALEASEPRVDRVLRELPTGHLNEQGYYRLPKIIKQMSDVFLLPGEPLTATNLVVHRIELTDAVPVFIRQYPIPQALQGVLQEQINKLLCEGVIEPSESPYNSPIWIVPKKDAADGSKQWRLVIDFRKLNEKTLTFPYPLPRIDQLTERLGGVNVYSVVDLASGFHQILLVPGDRGKTAFSTLWRHFYFVRMPFGIKNAPAIFQQQINKVVRQSYGKFVYIDDIIIATRDIESHEVELLELAERLRKANLKLSPTKCQLFREAVPFLGHVISPLGISPDPAKVSCVENFPTPKSVKNIEQFLGLCGYYRKYIPRFSRVAKPLTSLLKAGVGFVWSVDQEQAFRELRSCLVREPILQHPVFSEPFCVTTDASGRAIGGVLSQRLGGRDLPVAFASRTLTPTEERYSTIEKELLAMLFCAEQFKHCIYGRHFTFIVDHLCGCTM